ncbi:hypothetical protein N7520_010003 [Penicillium odoratum]|uniref:uncharacterized protein n=1 Tax=Penicillium odoratum TaxID=1167516 RepID=UPI0025478D79|nr:uncharacterized protein N7520_010003 [Penicillium odoratum]KAJ5753086.1 hypothetical protein N7520_010003 [Penicillium odoratum]
MKYLNAALLVAGLGGSFVQAGYSTECTDLTLIDAWLIGTCPTDDGTGEISSSVYLPNKIENTQGKLAWKVDGAYWDSCEDCELIDSGSTLQCYCDGTYSSEDGTTTLNLETYIANYDGHLLSNLTGAITSIPSNSSYAVPTDFEVELELSSLNNTCSAIGAYITMNDPTDCYYLNLGVEYTWACGKSIDNEGWEIVAFAAEDCSGDAVATYTPDNVGTCLTFSTGVQAFSITPLWNYD